MPLCRLAVSEAHPMASGKTCTIVRLCMFVEVHNSSVDINLRLLLLENTGANEKSNKLSSVSLFQYFSQLSRVRCLKS
jgi:hypothetical protein